MTPQLWGILNATPDSFYDGNPAHTPDTLTARADALIRAGADVLDIGGESTRPGSAPVDEPTELSRVLPVLQAVRARWPQVPVSLDTRHPAVAKVGLENGVQIINDVSGNPSEELFSLVKKYGAQLVIMHTRGTPQTMQQQTEYTDVCEEVYAFLSAQMARARAHGLSDKQLWLDVGFGFAKTREQNYTLLKNLARFKQLGARLLVALSRKSFLSFPNDTPQDRLPQTLAAQFYAAQLGADALRVHDVNEARQMLGVAEELSAL